MVHRHFISLSFVLLLVMAGSARLAAQPLENRGEKGRDQMAGIMVQAVRDMRFVPLTPMETRIISYLDADAALFNIDAEPSRTIHLTVLVDKLWRDEVEKGSGKKQMELEILPEHCAYSLDEGLTWHEFTSTVLNQSINIPPVTPGNTSFRVQVRIGGSITANQNQRRGGYKGHFTLAVEYH